MLSQSDKKDNSSIHNDALRKLVTIFNHAIGREWIDYNVAEVIYKSKFRVAHKKKKDKEEERLNIDDTNEVGAFALALIRYKPKNHKASFESARDLILTYFLSGGRFDEIRQTEWAWFSDKSNFSNWSSPKSVTKRSGQARASIGKILPRTGNQSRWRYGAIPGRR